MTFYQQGCPKGELDDRILRFREKLGEAEIDGALIMQKTDFFYFSGTIQQGWLYLPAEGKPLLMILKDYDRAVVESPLENIRPVVGAGKIPEILAEEGFPPPKILGLELDVLPANRYFSLERIFKLSKIVDVSNEIRLTRAIKSTYEMDFIKKACALSDRVLAKFPEFLESDVTEIKLAGRVEAYARELGHQGTIRMRLWGGELFYGHLLSGASAALPSFLSSPTGGLGTTPAIAQGPGEKPIRRHEPILLDYVFGYRGYLSDSTRVFALGKLSDELIAAHRTMLEIHEIVREKIRIGVSAGELYDLARQSAKDLKVDRFFMGATPMKIRFVGHGVGLELDEFPFIAQGNPMILQNGMVIALEPKLILPGQGAVGLENLHWVTENGAEQLTRHPPDITVV